MAKASLRQVLDTTPRPSGGTRCRTCLLLADLDGDDRDALQEYLLSEVSSRTIANALTSYGVRISQSAVSRHRRECEPLD